MHFLAFSTSVMFPNSKSSANGENYHTSNEDLNFMAIISDEKFTLTFYRKLMDQSVNEA